MMPSSSITSILVAGCLYCSVDGHPGGNIDEARQPLETTATLQPAAGQASTRTSTWTTVRTEWPYPFIEGHSLRYSRTYLITEIAPSIPTALPATVIHTGTTTALFTDRVYNSESMGNSDTYTRYYLSSTTWALLASAPTDMPAGRVEADVPCNECALPGAAPAPECEALNLTTACQGQCESREGVWWCRYRHPTDLNGADPSEVMGRVCWGTAGGKWSYHQLLTPCAASDHQTGCTPCEGRQRWSPRDWV